MGLGKLNNTIEIISTEPQKDSEGFVNHGDTVLATVRAYLEQKNSTEKWRSMAQSSEVNALFRFRCIPNLEITKRHFIVCNEKRYNIFSVENIKNRNMYVEVLAVSMDG